MRHGSRSQSRGGVGTAGTRASALWGKGGRGIALALALFCTIIAAFATSAASHASDGGRRAVVPQFLLDQASASPSKEFDVIVQGQSVERSGNLAKRIAKTLAKDLGAREESRILSQQLKREFRTISGVSMKLTGKQLVKLTKTEGVVAITPNATVAAAGKSNPQKWPAEIRADWYWNSPHANVAAGTIAIVDSGIQNDSTVFNNRLLTQVSYVPSGRPNSAGDGYGHGTFVAAIAAGDGSPYAGVAPNAKLVSLDVIDDNGNARTADVIAAADWIYANKGTYNIKVANFSLHAGVEASFMFDPLDKAVEKLWHSGVFVVASSGNYGTNGLPSGVRFAPGNDPFVMTVGALDVNGNTDPSNDFTAPWSAYGFTTDGFSKPEIGAPGRYMISTVPSSSKLYSERTGSRVSGGLLQLSGTSFAAPQVAGAGAILMAVHPEWTTDQVKGAMMLTASQALNAAPGSTGVGVLNLRKAIELPTTPPNPNLALAQFLVADASGTQVFDSEAWKAQAAADASWSSASWSSASWSSASWSSASWSSASWSSASWSSASWSSASWSSTSQVE